MLRHEGTSNLAVFAERAGGADLIEAHEPRVARNVSGYYGGQPASDPAWMRFGHDTQSRSRGALCTTDPPRATALRGHSCGRMGPNFFGSPFARRRLTADFKNRQ